jgi:valyl-tRNA synthetase
LRFAHREGKTSVHCAPLPAYREDWEDATASLVGDEIVRIVQEVRKHKTGKQIAMNAPIAKISVTTEHDLTLAENDLLATTKAAAFTHTKGEFKVDVE